MTPTWVTTKVGRPLVIRREGVDPLALRASIGGNEGIGWYLVYRGDPAKVLEMLEEVMAVVKDELS